MSKGAWQHHRERNVKEMTGPGVRLLWGRNCSEHVGFQAPVSSAFPLKAP